MDRQAEFREINSVVKLFERSVELFPNNPLVWEKIDGEYRPTTYREIKEEALNFSASLLKYGFRHGDRIAILAEGR